MTPELKEKLNGRRVVASVSGGKDSAALTLWLKELGVEHDRVFQDTGWEHPDLYEYLRGELTRVVGPITEIKGKKPWLPLVQDRGMFPSRDRRFCTQELKIFPMRDYIAGRQDAGEELVNAIGIRRDESQNRADALEWEWSDTFDCDVWRPLVEWTLDDVIAIHKRHGLLPNPMYLRGADRVGCWPCINSSKEEIARVAKETPWRIDEIRKLEADVQASATARYTARGETFESLGYKPPTMFALEESRAGKKKTDPRVVVQTPIDEVVNWARTSRGGKQLQLVDNGVAKGCMRWGLCDAPAKPANDETTNEEEVA